MSGPYISYIVSGLVCDIFMMMFTLPAPSLLHVDELIEVQDGFLHFARDHRLRRVVSGERYRLTSLIVRPQDLTMEAAV